MYKFTLMSEREQALIHLNNVINWVTYHLLKSVGVPFFRSKAFILVISFLKAMVELILVTEHFLFLYVSADRIFKWLFCTFSN